MCDQAENESPVSYSQFAGEDVYETKSNIRSDNPDMNGKEFKKYTSPLKVLCINLLKKNPE